MYCNHIVTFLASFFSKTASFDGTIKIFGATKYILLCHVRFAGYIFFKSNSLYVISCFSISWFLLHYGYFLQLSCTNTYHNLA